MQSSAQWRVKTSFHLA